RVSGRMARPLGLRYHAAGRLAGVLLPLPTVSSRKDSFADCQSTRAQGPEGREGEDEDTRPRRRAAEARRVHARHDADAEKAEFGVAQGRTRSPDERGGGRRVHPGRGSQPAGALRRARAWWLDEGSPGLSLQDHSRGAGHRRSLRPEAGPLEVRRQARLVMPRRGEVQVRPVEADAVYGSPLVTQVINKIMLDGKKSIA